MFFEYAIRERDLIQIRFAAVEGLAAQRNPMVRGILAGVAQSDDSDVVRLYAAYVLGKRGDLQGVDIVPPLSKSTRIGFSGRCRHISSANWATTRILSGC